MITEKRANELVKKHLKSYVKRLKLEAWTLEIAFQEISSEKTMGQCDCEGKYKDAKLLFDLRHIDDEKQFVDLPFNWDPFYRMESLSSANGQGNRGVRTGGRPHPNGDSNAQRQVPTS